MLLLKRIGLVVAVVVASGLSACNRETAPAQVSAAAQIHVAEQIAHPAWLRERLPEHTVAYLRIPSFWGLLSAPNGRPLDAALASDQHSKLIASLREAVRKDPTIAATGVAPALILLLGDLAAPIELAVIDGSDIANPASNFLLSVQLDVADVATLNARMTEFGGATPLLKAPIDANGKAALMQNGFLQFDPETHRLHALLGMAASASALDGLVKQLAQTRAHPMQESERGIDSAGQGLFFWMSLKGVNGMASAQLPKDSGGSLLRDFVDKSSTLAAGWGTHNGHGTFQIQLNAPAARLLSYLAPAGFKADLKSAGAPSWAVTAALPTAAQWNALESHLTEDFGTSASEQYHAAMGKIRNEVGVEFKDLIGLIGPELVAFEDASGTFSALRAKDRTALYARLDDLGKRFGWHRETLQSGSATMQHLYIPGIKLNDDKNATGDPKTRAWLALYSRIGRHLYWREEGEFLVFGQVPQALSDRADAKLDTTLADWLETQSYDAGHALFGATGVTHNVQRTVYYSYLNALQAIGEALGQPIDLAPLPNASALKLPSLGAIGISVDAASDRIGLRMTYEQTPVEALLGGGGTMTSIAAVGILAAVALPAYQDYTVRAQVASVIADSAGLEQAVAHYYTENGNLPASSDDLDLPDFGEATKYLDDYQIDGGALVLHFGNQADAGLHGKALVLKPYRAKATLGWQCAETALPSSAIALESTSEATSVPEKWLPSACR